MLGLGYVSICLLVSLLGYAITPDATRNANEQILSLAKKAPGTKVWILKTPLERARVDSHLWFWLGREATYVPVALRDTSSLQLTKTSVQFVQLTGQIDSLSLTLFEGVENKQAWIAAHCEHRTYWLGTDTFGRDLLSRILLGTRVSLAIGILAVAISLSLGLIVGGLAGFLGDDRLKVGGIKVPVDSGVMWFISVLWSLPTLLLALAITFVFDKGFWQLLLAIGLSIWVEVARLVRGQIKEVREQLFTEAGKALGYADIHILFRHVFPNIISPVIVIAVANFGAAVLIESGLSFLGIGVEVPVPTWGQMIYEGYTYIVFDYGQWLAFYPGLALILLIVSINLIGIGLRDALDVKL
ncbi:MAG: ABC transporter permease [Bacteroidota bacterium]